MIFKQKRIYLAVITIYFLLLIAACSRIPVSPTFQPPSMPTTVTTEKPVISQTIMTPSPFPTVQPTAPPRSLVVCVGAEPTSLFFYSSGSGSAQSILEAIYDGPYDLHQFDWKPVILERKPSLSSEDVRFEPVEVKPGELIVDAGGNWASLSEGVAYRVSGCTGSECVQTYSGTEPVMMDTLVVRFSLLPDLRWSDGAPLTADDSVYSYEVARSIFPRFRPDLLEHTRAYQALDKTAVEWQGVPGFQNAAFPSYFFSPLPRHAWGHLSSADLLQSDLTARTPLGWGAYLIDEWTPGDHITLKKNPLYSRAEEGLPYFDTLVFRFTGQGEEALAALRAGECDLVDETAHLETVSQEILQDQAQGRLIVSLRPNRAWEQLLFGIESMDPERPVFFAQREVRQAAAYCIDRSTLANAALPVEWSAPDTYVLPGHPLQNNQVDQYAYDPQKGAELLAAAGWIDNDQNPATPRQSAGVPGFTDGTPFEVTLLAPAETSSQGTAEQVASALSACGLKTEVVYQNLAEMLASGPDGPVFGRSFDLAQFGWATSIEPPCSLYQSTEIPGPYPAFPKGWGGANASGFRNTEFDRACQTATSSLPESAEYGPAHALAQSIFAADLPALPLYVHSALAAARPDFCGLESDPSPNSLLWNLEQFDYGESCQP